MTLRSIEEEPLSTGKSSPSRPADAPRRPAEGSASGKGEGKRSRTGRNLPVAIASGVLLAGLFVGSVFWHPLAFTSVVGLLALFGIFETAATFRAHGQPVAISALLVATAVMLVGAYTSGHAGQALGVAVLAGSAVGLELADKRRRHVMRRLGATFLLGLWIGLFASYGVLLVNRPEGALVTLAVVGAAVITDVGAYAFGSWLGRHKIAPSVSPAKTWEGLLGGLATAGVLAVVALPSFGDFFASRLDALLVALAAGVAGFFGDLMESMIKRDLGVKDMGALLPGHGGILDRVDGILVALPVGFYAVELFT